MADLLVFAAHPDDAEIHCGATIAVQVRLGATVAVIDATRGELGSRGSVEIREREATAASQALGLAGRENLGLPDGAVPADDPAARTLVVDAIRRHRPRAVLCLNGHARHPDHINLASLVHGAVKAASFHKLPTPSGAPSVSDVRLWFYEAELPVTPDFLVGATEDDWRRKMAAIRCFASQLHQPGSTAPPTSIATPEFLAWVEARGRAWGHHAGAPYAEAFLGPELPRLGDLRLI
jgi:bacillithiol biosynthesis deacetylase BshB1